MEKINGTVSGSKGENNTPMNKEKEALLVSIITVCYNSEKTIERTLKSVLEQSYTNYEYIIVDGKSEDNTINIVKSYEEKFQGRMHILSEPDDGIYDAMNKGIRMANGKLIGMVNSDDYYEKDAIKIMVEEYEKTKETYAVLYGIQRNYEGEKEVSSVLYHHDYLKKQMITHPTCFVTKAVYEDFGVFNTEYRSSADYEFMLRIYAEDQVKFFPVYKIISNFQMGGMSGSQVGYRETLSLQYRYMGLSKGRYIRSVIKSRIYEMIHGR